MGDAPDVPELQEDQTAGLVHRVGDPSPALDLLRAVDTGGPGVALSLLRYLGCLANDESGRSSLRVVAGVERRGNIARLAGARAGERCHDHAVGQVVAPELDGMKQPFRGRVPCATAGAMAGVDMTFSSDQNEWFDVLLNLKADLR